MTFLLCHLKTLTSDVKYDHFSSVVNGGPNMFVAYKDDVTDGQLHKQK